MAVPSNIFAVDFIGTNLLQLTTDGNSRSPVWSRDGSTILFQRGNNIFKMHSDGSGQALLLSAPGGQSFTPLAWSPDNTRFAYSVLHTATNLSDIMSAKADATDPVLMAANLNAPSASWGIQPVASTGGTVARQERAVRQGKAAPSDVTIQLGRVTVTFSAVTTSGLTSIMPIPPDSVGTVPDGFIIGGSAFDVTTTAEFTAPVDVCFTVPDEEGMTQSEFDALSLMHNEGGMLVDRTTSRDFATRQICATVDSLSGFALAEQVQSNMPSITGLVIDGNPLTGVGIHLSGAEERFAETDSDGFFQFVNLTTGNYNVEPSEAGFIFTEPNQIFIDVSGEESVVFTGTAGSFTISGKVADSDGNPTPDVEITLDGIGSATTDSNGDYSFPNLSAGGAYSIIPFKTGLGFTPDRTMIDNLSADLPHVDFVSGTTAMPTGVVSRKTHGAAGDFDVDLPLSGTPGVECRTGGATGDYQLVVTFGDSITVTGTPQADVTLGTGDIGTGGTANGGMVTVNGNVVTVPLTNVSTGQTINVDLYGVNNGTTTGNVVIPMSVLIGDTNGNGTVNAGDVAQTKGQSGQPVTGGNFRTDANANGSINAGDAAIVKSHSGESIPQ